MPASVRPATVLVVLPDRAHERALVRYLRYEVRPYSARYGHVLQSTPVLNVSSLARVGTTTLDQIGDPGPWVLRPTKASMGATGALGLRAQLFWSVLWRREPQLAERVIDPIYKPVHWHWESGVAIGYSAEDLERLAEVGRLRLQSAGVTADDVAVILPGMGALAHWQLALGTRRGGVPTLFAGDELSPQDLERLAPTVLAGTSAALHEVLVACGRAGVSLDRLRTLIVGGERLDGTARGALSTAAGAAVAIVSMWAPPGVRSLWGECRSGATFHLVPAVDHVELLEDEIVWTPVGWKGTVVLRLRTGIEARWAEGRCTSCGSTAPRLEIAAPLEPATPARRRTRKSRS